MSAASVSLNEARILLNDVAAANFTDAVLLPFLRKAYRELQQNLVDNGISNNREQSATTTIPAGTTAWTFSSSPALPSTLLYPIQMKEKISGADDSTLVDMIQENWVPDIAQTSKLVYWAWIDSQIRFVGATADVPVQLRYFESLGAITDATTNITILDSETFLASRTAALAAMYAGGNPTRATALQQDAITALDLLLGTAVKERQSMPVRRRRFQAFGRRSFWNW